MYMYTYLYITHEPESLICLKLSSCMYGIVNLCEKLSCESRVGSLFFLER